MLAPDDTVDDDAYHQPAPRPPDPPNIPTEISTPADDPPEIAPVSDGIHRTATLI